MLTLTMSLLYLRLYLSIITMTFVYALMFRYQKHILFVSYLLWVAGSPLLKHRLILLTS